MASVVIRFTMIEKLHRLEIDSYQNHIFCFVGSILKTIYIVVYRASYPMGQW